MVIPKIQYKILVTKVERLAMLIDAIAIIPTIIAIIMNPLEPLPSSAIVSGLPLINATEPLNCFKRQNKKTTKMQYFLFKQ